MIDHEQSATAPDKAPKRPYLDIVENTNPRSAFSHWEIRTVRLWHAPGDVTEVFFESVDDDAGMADDAEFAAGPVLYGLYGQFDPTKRPADFGSRDTAPAFGGAENIKDFDTLEDAQEFRRFLNGP